jgi:uncharacterized protein (DUF1800 family)
MKTLLRSTVFLYCASFFILSGLEAQSVAVTPAEPYIGVGSQVQFSAAVTGLSSPKVTWALTGLGTNNPKLGSITQTGLYTAPATVPAQNPVTIQATGADGKTIGIAYALIEPLGPTLTSVTPNPVNIGTYKVTVNGSGFVKGAGVLAGGVALSATFVSSTQLNATGYQGPAGTVPFSVSNPGTLSSNVINVGFVAPLTVSPATASVALGASKTFSVSGQSVTWTASAGSITSGGVFTAPLTMPASSTVTITATGGAGQTGTAKVTLTQPETPAAPPTFNPTAGTYTTAQSVTLSTTTAGASIRYTTDGTTPTDSKGTLYSAAIAIGTTTTVKAVAYKTGMSDSTVASSTYTINLPAVTISVTPPSASLSASQQQSITATVTNSSNTGVAWTISGAGTLSSTSGSSITYTAPASIATKATVTITATSAADTTKMAVSTITLNPPVVTGGPITVSPATVSMALNGTQTFTASGQTNVTWSASAGTITSSGVFTAPSATTPTGTVTITASGTNNQAGIATVTLTGGTTLVSAAAAQRFLQQAAFGPTSADVANVQTLGFQGWLNQQFAMGRVSNYDTLTTSLPARFLTNSVMNADQLRQRVAFALSQIAVVSLNSLIFPNNVSPYEDMLLSDAFTNYRQILGDVTLSPSMGEYLTMVNNAAANPTLGTVANENYAREIMQLFSIGVNVLNQDGSVQTDSSGIPLPTYNQKNVTELARVFTGWTYAQTAPNPPVWGAGINDGNTDVTSPMVAVPQYHDTGSKTLLPDYVNGNGTPPYVAPAGLAQAADLSAALDNLFYQPNVAPFIGKQLIQHLVKSNPSPAYISRVAAAFANNGQGVRGDMRAVITAVLLDPEARANDAGGNDQSTDGHMQEPGLFLAGIIRAFNGTANDQNYFSQDLANMGQDIFNAGSVFNYYAPNYVVPQTTLTGGEFQIFNTYTSIYRGNLVSNLFFSSFSNPVMTYGPGTSIDLTSYVALSKTPAALVNALDLVLTRGQLPAAVKTVIATAVAAEDPAGYSNGMRQVQTALYLIATSNYYNVWH